MKFAQMILNVTYAKQLIDEWRIWKMLVIICKVCAVLTNTEAHFLYWSFNVDFVNSIYISKSDVIFNMWTD